MELHLITNKQHNEYTRERELEKEILNYGYTLLEKKVLSCLGAYCCITIKDRQRQVARDTTGSEFVNQTKEFTHT